MGTFPKRKENDMSTVIASTSKAQRDAQRELIELELTRDVVRDRWTQENQYEIAQKRARLDELDRKIAEVKDRIEEEFGDLNRADIIGERIRNLTTARDWIKRGVITSEMGSVDQALAHPLVVKIEAELESLTQELVNLV